MRRERLITAVAVVGLLLAIAVALLQMLLEEIWDNRLEVTAAAFGLVGAWLLATKGQHAAWAWWAFLASNAGWIAFGWIRRHWFLLLQQVGFTASSVVGIATWWTP